MKTTRREFLYLGAGTAALALSPAGLPEVLARTAGALGRTGAPHEGILVLVQLTGGNDGLNTVIPHQNDAYRRARPTLAVPKGQVLELNDDLGLHPQMAGFKRLYDEGLLAVVQNVGYPQPDRSHFRSMDIWHTATTTPEGTRTGWLGRALDTRDPGDAGTGGGAPGLHLGGGPLPRALIADRWTVPSVSDISAFQLRVPAGDLEVIIREERAGPTKDLRFVQETAAQSLALARRIEEVIRHDAGGASYPAGDLGQRLRQIARLIGAGFGPRIYFTSTGGFDTHAKQALVHGQLLKNLSDGVSAFFEDLKQRSQAPTVTLITFSEFGRRVQENGSQGTDHGAAAPLFVAGSRCAPGIHGDPPDLVDLDNGDVRFRIDFRRVYAAALKSCLGCDPEPILGGTFDPVSVIR